MLSGDPPRFEVEMGSCCDALMYRTDCRVQGKEASILQLCLVLMDARMPPKIVERLGLG